MGVLVNAIAKIAAAAANVDLGRIRDNELTAGLASDRVRTDRALRRIVCASYASACAGATTVANRALASAGASSAHGN